MKRSILTLSSFLIVSSLFAQHTISGVVQNQQGNLLHGSTILDVTRGKFVTTQDDGSFKLSLEAGMHILKVDFLGYKTIMDTIQLEADIQKTYVLTVEALMAEEFVLEGTRVSGKTPLTYQNLKKADIEANNLGQDLPILLNQTISAVSTSDAGAGIGYTGIRIRGSDATRINVTVNGVPLNDAESHGVFWVNMPDFSSSIASLQIQRGIGSSTNGAGAFGASINMNTSEVDTSGFVEFNNTLGSFNTRKHNVIYNSGLLKDHLVFEGRLSYLTSDGFIDRSASNLHSYYLSTAYYHQKFLVKAVVFSGKERTHQAWYGTPESRINNDDQQMLIHATNNGYSDEQTENLLNSGRTYNYYTYNNEIDDYGQDHYQLISNVQLSPRINLNLIGHYTRGKGYFEQWKPNSAFEDFGFDNPVIGSDTIKSADFVIQRWLDNHFYGTVYALQYRKKTLEIKLGGSYNEYLGEHYGKIIWAEIATTVGKGNEYYFSNSNKKDAANYLRFQYQIGRISFYADLQHRYVDYRSAGVDNDQRTISINKYYSFINPKAGVNWNMNVKNSFYLSVAQASREPVRSDFVDAIVDPKPEQMTDIESGWRFEQGQKSIGINGFLMHYNDQLVLTGEVNDVGSPIRSNVDESYRMGLEAYSTIKLKNGIEWRPNFTLSRNKIVQFNELIYDYTTGYDIELVNHSNSDIAFSPSVIVGSNLGYNSSYGLSIFVLSKYVGRQYLDNTSNSSRAIDAYFVNDVRVSYRIKSQYWKSLEATILVNNFLNIDYESNGYTYSYIYGSLITENFYYPQAGINWLAGLKWRF